MPSLDALLLNSKNNASLFALNNSANAGATTSSQFSFGGNASTASSQSSFGDALDSAWSPTKDDASSASTAPTTDQPSPDQEAQTTDQTSSWQQNQTEKSSTTNTRRPARHHKTNADDASTPSSDAPAETPSADAPTSSTPAKTDSPDTNDPSKNTPQTSTTDKHPHVATADEQAAATSAQTTIIAQHPTTHAAHAATPPATPAGSDALPTKIQPKATTQTPTTGANPATPAPPSQSAKLDATPDNAPTDPDSQSPADPNEKQNPGLPNFQSAAKQAAKIDQQDNSSPNPAPAVNPDSPQPALSQTAQALAAAAIGNPTTSLTPAADQPKSAAPAASPIALTTATSPQPATASSSANAAAPAQQLPPSDQDQTFEQVVMGLRGKLDPQNGRAEIHLEPPNLGTLHVSLTLTNGSLTAQFQSSSDVVRNLLSTHMEKLKTALEGQGVAVGKIAVEPPANTSAAGSEKAPAPSPSNNDGRSAGQYYRDPQQNQRRSANPSASFQPWSADAASSSPQDAPIDVVA